MAHIHEKKIRKRSIKEDYNNPNGEMYVDALLADLIKEGFQAEVQIVLGFAQVLKQRRADVGYTVRDIAKLMGMNKNTIVGIEKGKPSTSIFTIIKYAKFLGLTISLHVNLATVVENRMDRIINKISPDLKDLDDGLEVD